MNAYDDNWYYHSGTGIISDCKNDTPSLYVLIYGYDKDDEGRDYLIGKNNWGARWGDKGFFKIYPDTCGILNTNKFIA